MKSMKSAINYSTYPWSKSINASWLVIKGSFVVDINSPFNLMFI